MQNPALIALFPALRPPAHHLAAFWLAALWLPCFWLTAPDCAAQVAEWNVFKAIVDTQEADNAAPASPEGWRFQVVVRTTQPGDFAGVTLSGGGLLAPVPLLQQGPAWLLQLDFPSKAAMDAQVPSSATYVLQGFGGTLGTLTQAVPLPPESYPVTPHLIQNDFSLLRSFDESQAADIDWNPIGVGMGGLVLFGLTEVGSGFRPVTLQSVTGATTVTMQAKALSPNACYQGELSFGITGLVAGAGGFGVPGGVGHGRATRFDAATFTAMPATQVNVNPINAQGQPVNPQAFTAAPTGLIPGQVWQPSVDHTVFAPAAALDLMLVSFLPLDVPTPNGQLLLDPAGSLTPLLLVPAGTPFGVAVPWNCAFFGRTVRAQAASVYPSGFLQLTNALELTVGGV